MSGTVPPVSPEVKDFKETLTKYNKSLKAIKMEDVANYLIEKEVLTIASWGDLKAMTTSQTEQTEIFLEQLEATDDAKGFEHFIHAARKSGYDPYATTNPKEKEQTCRAIEANKNCHRQGSDSSKKSDKSKNKQGITFDIATLKQAVREVLSEHDEAIGNAATRNVDEDVITSLQDEINQLEQTIKEKEQQLEKVGIVQKDLSDKEMEVLQLKEQMAAQNEQILQIYKEMEDSYLQQLIELSEELENANATIARLEKEKEELERLICSLEKELNELRENVKLVKVLEREKGDLEIQIASKATKMQNLKKRLHDKEKELQHLKSAAQAKSFEMEGQERKLRCLQNNRSKHTKMIEENTRKSVQKHIERMRKTQK